jgi:hypothetical protein
VDWIYLAQDTEKWPVLVKTTVHIRVPLNVVNFLTIGRIISRSLRSLPHGVSSAVSVCDSNLRSGL